MGRKWASKQVLVRHLVLKSRFWTRFSFPNVLQHRRRAAAKITNSVNVLIIFYPTHIAAAAPNHKRLILICSIFSHLSHISFHSFSFLSSPFYYHYKNLSLSSSSSFTLISLSQRKKKSHISYDYQHLFFHVTQSVELSRLHACSF